MTIQGDDREAGRRDPPAYPGPPPRRPSRGKRRPVPVETHLWGHVLAYGALAVVSFYAVAVYVPRSAGLLPLVLILATTALVTWYAAFWVTSSVLFPAYLLGWGVLLTGWTAYARVAGPWHVVTAEALILPAIVLTALGAPVIGHHLDRTRRPAGFEPENERERQHWQDLLPKLDVPGVRVKDVIHHDTGYQVHCEHGKAAEGRRVNADSVLAGLDDRVTKHKRLPRGSVHIEDKPAGGSAADFIIHVTTVTGPRPATYLPAENRRLTITRALGLGILDTGREFALKLREVVVLIAGVIGSGKSTLLNIFLARLACCEDAVVWMIDLKGGREARAWMMPYLKGTADKPVIDWLATTRGEAKIMLDAAWAGGQARARSGAGGRKIRPSRDRPALIILLDEGAVLTGHRLKEDGVSSAELSTRLLQIAETFRSEAISPVVSAVRANVDVMGSTGLKAMTLVRIGMQCSTAEEGRSIFPDHLHAARTLAQLKNRGDGLVLSSRTMSPVVHFYNITDGYPDDDGNPTADRIGPVATYAGNNTTPQLEETMITAMGEAYANRWERAKSLLDEWRRGTDEPEPASPQDDPPGGEEEDIALWAAELEGRAAADLGDGDGNPARKRMRELLIARGRAGYKSGALWHLLLNEGQTVSRETVVRWLGADKKLGYVQDTGRPRSVWVWRLLPGQEFDIPGWDRRDS